MSLYVDLHSQTRKVPVHLQARHQTRASNVLAQALIHNSNITVLTVCFSPTSCTPPFSHCCTSIDGSHFAQLWDNSCMIMLIAECSLATIDTLGWLHHVFGRTGKRDAELWQSWHMSST